MTNPKCTLTFLGELEIIKKELKEQKSKYLNLLEEHEKQKAEMTKMVAENESKFDTITKRLDDQNVKLNATQSESLVLARELKNALEKNHSLKKEMNELSRLFNKKTMSTKHEEFSDEERAIVIYNKLPCLIFEDLEVFRDQLMNPKVYIALVSKKFSTITFCDFLRFTAILHASIWREIK